MATGDQASLKHTSIAATLEREIRSGHVPRGRQLPGEHTLAARFAVSRTTVRQALSDLSRAGLIATHTGKGSFVTYNDTELDTSNGWAVALAAGGVQSEVELLRAERVVDAALATRVGRSSPDFIAIERVRRVADGAPISYERSRIPADGALAAVPSDGLIDDSITATLRAAGLVGVRGEQWVSVQPLTGEQASILEREPGHAFVQSTRLSRTATDEFVEFVESALDPTKFQLHLSFS